MKRRFVGACFEYVCREIDGRTWKGNESINKKSVQKTATHEGQIFKEN